MVVHHCPSHCALTVGHCRLEPPAGAQRLRRADPFRGHARRRAGALPAARHLGHQAKVGGKGVGRPAVPQLLDDPVVGLWRASLAGGHLHDREGVERRLLLQVRRRRRRRAEARDGGGFMLAARELLRGGGGAPRAEPLLLLAVDVVPEEGLPRQQLTGQAVLRLAIEARRRRLVLHAPHLSQPELVGLLRARPGPCSSPGRPRCRRRQVGRRGYVEWHAASRAQPRGWLAGAGRIGRRRQCLRAHPAGRCRCIIVVASSSRGRGGGGWARPCTGSGREVGSEAIQFRLRLVRRWSYIRRSCARLLWLLPHQAALRAVAKRVARWRRRRRPRPGPAPHPARPLATRSCSSGSTARAGRGERAGAAGPRSQRRPQPQCAPGRCDPPGNSCSRVNASEDGYGWDQWPHRVACVDALCEQALEDGLLSPRVTAFKYCTE